MIQRGAGNQPEAGVTGAFGAYDEQPAAVVTDRFVGVNAEQFDTWDAVRGEPEDLTPGRLKHSMSGPAFFRGIRVAQRQRVGVE